MATWGRAHDRTLSSNSDSDGAWFMHQPDHAHMCETAPGSWRKRTPKAAQSTVGPIPS